MQHITRLITLHARRSARTLGGQTLLRLRGLGALGQTKRTVKVTVHVDIDGNWITRQS